VTRNGYGSAVLNTERVMFVDIDFADHAGNKSKSLFKGLFGGKPKSAEDEKEDRARLAVDQFITANPSWGMRLYRTFAGLRAIVTHDVMDPQHTATLEVLKQLGQRPAVYQVVQGPGVFSCPADAQAVALRLHTEPAAASDHRPKAIALA